MKFLRLDELKLQSGMDLIKAGNGIAETPNINGKISESQRQCHALFVETPFSLHSHQEQNTALSAASISTVSRKPPTIKESVWCAARALWRISTGQLKVAPLTVDRFCPIEPETVFNLTLEKDNVYFANGILVDNCIAVEGARRRGFKIGKLANVELANQNTEWLRTMRDKVSTLNEKKALQYD